MNLITSTLHSSSAPNGVNGAVQSHGGTSSVIRQYLHVMMRWRYIIAGVIAFCIFLGVVATFLATPKYTATTTLEISRESDKVTNFQGVERETSVADQEFYQTQYGLLKSRSLSERVAAELNLVDDPAFFRMYGVKSQAAAFQQANGQYPASGREMRQRVAGAILQANINVTPARLSRLVDVGFRSPDAAFSAKVVNAWADNFIQTNLERKVQATSYGRDLLQKQLVQFKEKLDQSQRQLVAYASAQRIINLPAQAGGEGQTSSERSIVVDNLAALNAALNQATAERIQAEARYRQEGHNGGSSEALQNVAINNLRQKRAELAAEYQRLMVQFEPGYPAARAVQSQINQLDRSIGQEERRVSGSLLGEFRQAQQREAALQSKVEALKANYLDLRRRSIQYNIYQQEVDTNRALYDGLLQRFKEIGVTGGVGVNNISIVDPAEVPTRPSSPRPLINFALSLLIGIGLGVALSMILEQLDEAISDPAEIERRLGLPLLGSVPKVEYGTPIEALLDRKSDLVDAYLSVQTNLGFTTEHGVPRSFAVTSTRPSEGKSTTALALAAMLARAQRKVILVDGDMRSPSVHQFGNTTHIMGLSNFLAGEDDIDALTFSMKDLGFTAMSAGPIPPNAAELLTGSRLEVLISRLREVFDHVIIDSPPVMGLADAPLIASRVEGVIFTVESHKIRTALVKTAIGRLEATHARIFGTVLTKFEARKTQYSYGYEYGYGYGRDARGQRK